ncbi:MAG: BtaA family protein [Spirochaetia bacterium]|nr:BtaA family protein [Spirochaetia bacterium]
MKQPTYNQVWEDYEVDRLALGVQPGQNLLMIASGGCNVLNTLLEDPAKIYALDQNQAQLQLLERKIEAIRRGYGELWKDFGIPAQSRNDSVYAHGSYARFRWVRKFFQAVCGNSRLRQFIESPDLTAQGRIYIEEIEPRLWRLPVRVLPTALAGVCGMHWRQVLYSARAGQFFLEQACRNRLRNILTKFPIRENYFWHQMLTGTYSDEHNVPLYLRECNFNSLSRRTERIKCIHSDLLTFLKQTQSDFFSAANLLDLLEFISPALRTALFQELHRVCKPEAIVLFRTFAPALKLNSASSQFHFKEDLSHTLSLAERTASYASVHVYSVTK